MSISLGALSPITTTAQSLSNLVLVTPQSAVGYAPQNPKDQNGTPSKAPPPPPLLFHYEAEQAVTLDSEITDHFIEDNYAIQDHIALKPEIFTVQGFIGELNDVPPPALAPIKAAADRLTTIVAFVPQVSATAQIAYNEAFFLYQTAANVSNSAVSAWNSISGSKESPDTIIGGNVQDGIKIGSVQNKQQKMFSQFYAYWKNRTLFNVQTPWALFQNMAILHLSAIQDESTRVITDFEITFKMIRTAATIKVGTTGLLTSFDGRAAAQASDLKSIGTYPPQPSIGSSSALSGMLGVA